MTKALGRPTVYVRVDILDDPLAVDFDQSIEGPVDPAGVVEAPGVVGRGRQGEQEKHRGQKHLENFHGVTNDDKMVSRMDPFSGPLIPER
jgi:hypothetical protein